METISLYSSFSSLYFRLGRSSQQIVGLLLHFWDARNIKKDGVISLISFYICIYEPLTYHTRKNIAFSMIFELCHPWIHTSNTCKSIPRFLREGLIFQVGVFEVGRCTNLYRITYHPFVIRFLPDTTIVVNLK